MFIKAVCNKNHFSYYYQAFLKKIFIWMKYKNYMIIEDKSM